MFNPGKEFQVEIPAASVLYVCALSDPLFTGFSCTRFTIHEISASGTCTIFMCELLSKG